MYLSNGALCFQSPGVGIIEDGGSGGLRIRQSGTFSGVFSNFGGPVRDLSASGGRFSSRGPPVKDLSSNPPGSNTFAGLLLTYRYILLSPASNPSGSWVIHRPVLAS